MDADASDAITSALAAPPAMSARLHLHHSGWKLPFGQGSKLSGLIRLPLGTTPRISPAMVYLRCCFLIVAHLGFACGLGVDANPHDVALEMLHGVADKNTFDKLQNVTMRMTRAEANLWFSLLLTGSTYLEWGTGGSTVLAAWRATQAHMPPFRIDTVDSSQDWWDELRHKHLVLAEAESIGRLVFHKGDIGQTVIWGKPAAWNNRAHAQKESQARAYVENNLSCCYDIIFIDGRFREACAMKVLTFAHNNTIVMVHDAQRYVGSHSVQHNYHQMLKVGSLIVLRPQTAARARAWSHDRQYLSEFASKLMDYERRKRRM